MNLSATVEHKYSRIAGAEGTLFVDDGGEGNIPVVFVHSFAGDVSHWKDQLDHVREARRAIAFDLRGHGKSDPVSSGNYSIEAMANDVAALVDGLDLERFILVGHSMGGSASIEYADSHTSRVAGLMIAGTPGKTSEEISKPVISSLRSDAYQQVMDDYIKQLLKHGKPEVVARIDQGRQKLSRATTIELIKALFDFDPIEKLTRYPGPKLVVYADGEGSQPNALIKQVPQISNVAMAGTSHWMHLDKPLEFNTILDNFLREIDKKELR
jgi:pimeloyl-ACP methyl ester carboxylesterase